MNDFARRYAAGRRRPGLLRWGFHLRSRLVLRNVAAGARVLDVGAADGEMLEHIASKLGLSLAVNLERNPRLAAVIARNGVCGSGVALPFASEVFDVVVCCATRKHVADSRTLAREMARVLRSGGRLIVVDPHPWLLRLGRCMGKFDPRYLHHLSSVSSIAREMEEAGLDVERRQDGPFLCCVARKPEAGAARDLGGRPAERTAVRP